MKKLSQKSIVVILAVALLVSAATTAYATIAASSKQTSLFTAHIEQYTPQGNADSTNEALVIDSVTADDKTTIPIVGFTAADEWKWTSLETDNTTTDPAEANLKKTTVSLTLTEDLKSLQVKLTGTSENPAAPIGAIENIISYEAESGAGYAGYAYFGMGYSDEGGQKCFTGNVDIMGNLNAGDTVTVVIYSWVNVDLLPENYSSDDISLDATFYYEPATAATE